MSEALRTMDTQIRMDNDTWKETGQSGALVEVEHMVKEFPVGGGMAKKSVVHAISDVSLTIHEGETLALVGESGCGKSTLGRLILRLLAPTSGAVRFEGKDLAEIPTEELRNMRRRFQIIFQDPYASLNPRMTVSQIIAEPLNTHKACATKEETEARVKELMKRVGMEPGFMMTGGVAKNPGVVKAVEDRIGAKLYICPEPEIVGAAGAALYALDRVTGKV